MEPPCFVELDSDHRNIWILNEPDQTDFHLPLIRESVDPAINKFDGPFSVRAKVPKSVVLPLLLIEPESHFSKSDLGITHNDWVIPPNPKKEMENCFTPA